MRFNVKYRKKPVVIEAVQWNGVNINEIKNFVGHALDCIVNSIIDLSGKWKTEYDIKIKTLEGIHHASKGDYIIKGVNGEFYPCKPDIFEKTYDEV